MKEYSKEDYEYIHNHVYPALLLLDLGTDIYRKDNSKCPFMHKINEISICSWNNKPCEKVPFESCRTFGEEDYNE